ncbi:hypothetical protein GCM10027277_22250 [Pseudoduganella ginsengisoli]
MVLSGRSATGTVGAVRRISVALSGATGANWRQDPGIGAFKPPSVQMICAGLVRAARFMCLAVQGRTNSSGS